MGLLSFMKRIFHPKNYQVPPPPEDFFRQELLGHLDVMSSLLNDIEYYLEAGKVDEAVHDYNSLLESYCLMQKEPIPFQGKLLLYEKVRQARKLVEGALLGAPSGF